VQYDKSSGDDTIGKKEEQVLSEEPEWLIPRKKEEDISTHQSLFSTTTVTTGLVTKAPPLVDMTQTGTTPDTTKNITPHIKELLLPLEVPSSTQPRSKGRPPIEEIKETTTDNSQMLSSSTNFFITESLKLLAFTLNHQNHHPPCLGVNGLNVQTTYCRD